MKKNKEMQWDASRPMTNPRKELFAELYTFEFWGSPVEAAAKAGYKVISKKRIRMLLTDSEVVDRVRYLRKQLASQTVADEAWIKNNFIEIVQNADKPADKLRALAGLYRAVVDSEKGVTARKEESAEEFPFDDEDL